MYMGILIPKAAPADETDIGLPEWNKKEMDRHTDKRKHNEKNAIKKA